MFVCVMNKSAQLLVNRKQKERESSSAYLQSQHSENREGAAVENLGLARAT